MFALLKSTALAVVLTVTALPAAAATSIKLTSSGIYNPGAVDVTTPSSGTSASTTITDLAGVVRFTANRGGTNFDLLGFCIDLFHPISAGIGRQVAINLKYTRGAFLTDRNGNSVSNVQAGQIGGLAEIGFDLARGNAADRDVRLAAIQQAIWTIEYPAQVFAATSRLPGQQALVDAYLAQAPSLSHAARVIYADDGATQGFVVSGVPEPTTWAMLVVGFGMAGIATRRRRGLARVSA